MKQLLLFAFLLTSLFIFSQAPQGMSYQAVAFDTSGSPINNGNVGVRVSILDNSATGTEVYVETHSKTTNAQGLFNLNIGQGSPSLGTFSEIDWGTNAKFLKVEVDPNGGTNYVNVGTNQLMSVPYALYAENGGSGGQWVTNSEDRLGYDGGDVDIEEAGSGLWLTSPNGTKFKIAVNDAGELSLPTSGVISGSDSTQLYLYGSFNSWDAQNALLMNNFFIDDGCGGCGADFFGFSYFEAGTELRFLTAQNENAVYGGVGLNGNLIEGGSAITIPSDGYYVIEAFKNGDTIGYNITSSSFDLTSFVSLNYNEATDEFSRVGANTSTARLTIEGIDTYSFGDNINNGQLDLNGDPFPLSNNKFYAKFAPNFNGTGTYEVNDIVNVTIELLDDSDNIVNSGYEIVTSASFSNITLSQFDLSSAGITHFRLSVNSFNEAKIGGGSGSLELDGDWIVLPYSDGVSDITFNILWQYATYTISY